MLAFDEATETVSETADPPTSPRADWLTCACLDCRIIRAVMDQQREKYAYGDFNQMQVLMGLAGASGFFCSEIIRASGIASDPVNFLYTSTQANVLKRLPAHLLKPAAGAH